MKQYWFDSHVHSSYSPDGNASIEDLCIAAIEKGLDGFCLTDHCEVNDYIKDHYEETIKGSHHEMRRMKEKYKEQLNLRIGIELGQPMQDQLVAEKILKQFPCDFIIGSMHNVKGEKDFYYMESEDEFKDKLDFLLTSYYEEYYEMVKWGKFDIIGHITYPLRYLEGIFHYQIKMQKYNEIIYEMLKTAVQKGIGIEINVSGYRQPYGKPFPNREHIKWYHDLGGKVITIGTDSHTAEVIGSHMAEGMEILRQEGFKYYTRFEERKPIMISL